MSNNTRSTPYKGEYMEDSLNRFENIDSIEWKIVSHLINSETKHADNIWKILAHDTDIDALSSASVPKQDRDKLVFKDNGEETSKRVFLQPFVNEAWSEQCSSVYIYVDEIIPQDKARANVIVTVEVIVHAEASVIRSNADQISNPNANPNDSDKQGNIVVTRKNRATVLLKSLIAELNGLFLDGIGYLVLDQTLDKKSGASLSLWNSRSFYGYQIKFATKMSGVSDNPDVGF